VSLALGDLLEVLRVVVDVLLVFLLVFSILRLLKTTGALNLAYGLGLILLVYFAAYAFNLSALLLMLSRVGRILVFALVVIFAPEIRRWLSRVGQGGVLHWLIPGRPEPLEQIVPAVRQMAKKRIGALIALSRSGDTTPLMERGQPIDGLVSTNLLLTIFSPYTALHDGAVVIREDRIVAAGCMLPLSRTAAPQDGKPLALGTRHLAGLGASEQTDAVVIIVSEERGSISLAEAGMLEEVTAEKLPTRLQEMLMESPQHTHRNEEPRT